MSSAQGHEDRDDERTVRIKDLIDAPGIADRLGLRQYQTVHSWLTRHPDFPRPVCTFGRVRVWDWPEVRAWAIATGRLPADG